VLVPRGVHRYSMVTAQAVLDLASRARGRCFLAGNLTRRVDFALFMVAALENDELIYKAPAIVGCWTPSASAHAADAGLSTGH
jgi:hypothetical protein